MIGQRIKEARLKLGYSAEQVAAFLNVSPATVYRYENGDISKLPSKFIKPLAEYLCVSPSWLMGWVSDEEYQQRWAEYQAEQELLREPLSTDEKQLLSCYRVLPDPGKQYIHQQMRAAQLMYGEKSADISDSFMK